MAIIKTVSNPYPQTGKTTTTFAEGCVLRVWTDTVQVMSDIWESALFAEYWDEATATVKTDMWLDSGTKVDATAEVVAKAEAWLYAVKYERSFQKRKAYEEQEARKIVKECRVKVVAGRTAKGLEGKVAVIITRPYGMGYRASLENKLAIAKSEVKVKVPGPNGRVYENYRDIEWVWARNCERLDVPAIDLESVKEAARNEAAWEVKNRKWASPARS